MALQIHREIESGRMMLRLEGTLDGRTAHQLRDTLGTAEGREVVLDFSLVRDFKDTAVAVLTRDLQSLPPVQLRGLTGHPARMFRYFGLALDSAPSHAGDAEPGLYTADELLAG
jgi:anti-anti-sigma regulatory factor